MNHNHIFSVPYPFEDRVFHKTELQSHKVEAFCNKLKVMKANLKKVCNGYNTVLSFNKSKHIYFSLTIFLIVLLLFLTLMLLQILA